MTLTRRTFLAGATAGLVGCACESRTPSATEEPLRSLPLAGTRAARVGLIFAHVAPDTPVWPGRGYDYDRRKAELASKLTAACTNTRFVQRTVMTAEEAERAAVELRDLDGYVIFLLGQGARIRTLLETGKPMVVIDHLFGGTVDLIFAHVLARKRRLPIVTVGTSEVSEVLRAARLFETLTALRSSRLLVVRDDGLEEAAQQSRLLGETLGITVERLGHQDLGTAYTSADAQVAERWAKRWAREARRVVGPSVADILAAARLHVALAGLLRERRAQAISIDCLGGFYSGLLPAYPCLSYRQLNDEGFVGACETDQNSAAAMLIVRHLTGRPGFISDPAFDLPKGQIIYAHCVAPTRPFGPGQPANPFLIRTHAEDNRGAAIQSLLPLGHKVTTINVSPALKLLTMHTAVSVANLDDPRGCRTKLVAKADVDAILNSWEWGPRRNLWHRVTVFGDWTREIAQLATLLGYAVQREDRAR